MSEANTSSNNSQVQLRTALMPTKEDRQPASSRMPKWNVRWWSAMQMGGLFLLGLATAVGHHVLYTSLDGSLAGDVERQEWSIRFGTALAYLTQTSLAASVVCAYSQHIWTIFKARSISIKGISAMFSASTDPIAFGTTEMWIKAKLGSIMVVAAWYLYFASFLQLY